jgi:hypothetical protein
VSGQYVVLLTLKTKMADSDVSVKVHFVDNKQSKVEHQTSPSETDDINSIQQTATSTPAGDDCGYLPIVSDDLNNSIQQAATSTSADDDCDYLLIVSDVLSAGETVKTVNDSESDVTDSNTHSLCNIQHEDSNSATGADDHMYMIITDDNDVSTQSLIQCHVSYNYLANTFQAYRNVFRLKLR